MQTYRTHLMLHVFCLDNWEGVTVGNGGDGFRQRFLPRNLTKFDQKQIIRGFSKLSKSGRSAVERVYNWDSEAAKLKDMYKKLLAH